MTDEVTQERDRLLQALQTMVARFHAHPADHSTTDQAKAEEQARAVILEVEEAGYRRKRYARAEAEAEALACDAAKLDAVLESMEDDE